MQFGQTTKITARIFAGIFAGVAALASNAAAECSEHGHHDMKKVEASLKKNYGAKISLASSKAMPLEKAIADFDKNGGKEVLVHAKVEKVCQTKGCWMGIGEKNLKVRVTFKDYGFFVSPKLVGHNVHAQGRIVAKTMSVAEAKHYAKDAGKSDAEIAKISKPVKEYRFVASAVEVVGG